MRKLALFLAFSALSVANAQSPMILWQKSYGGSTHEGAYSIAEIPGGGLIVGGYNWSNDGDVHDHHGANWYPDGWIIRLDNHGDTLWTKSLGGTDEDYVNSVIPTDDGGFIAAAQTRSDDGDITATKGWWDFWIVKLDGQGTIEWQKNYGGTEEDVPYQIKATTDGGYIVVGASQSNDGDVAGHHGTTSYEDVWVIKIDSLGTLQWEKSYGGTDGEKAYSIDLTQDGGYVIGGYSWSADGDLTQNAGSTDFWAFKIDSAGNLIWQKSLGGSYYDYGTSIAATLDGGYVIAGQSASDDVDVPGNAGSFDAWIVKLSAAGSIVWSKNYGGSYSDGAAFVQSTPDAGCIIAGFSTSPDGTPGTNLGEEDFWILKLAHDGAIQWNSVLGGDSLDQAFYITPLSDGAYAACGFSKSFTGDLTQNNGSVDFWVVKLRCTPPQNSEICLATVDSTSTKNLLVWEKPVTNTISHFNIYRDVVGQFTLIDTVQYGSLSEYIDNSTGINPQITSYRYKISSVDTCGYESELSSHNKTIHLTNNAGTGGEVNLLWDNYEGFNFNYYRIYRKSTASGNQFAILDSVTNQNTTYTDIAPPAGQVSYVIEVVPFSGTCVATEKSKTYNSSRSNVSQMSGGSTGTAPVANFTATGVVIDAGQSIDFFDLSQNTPTAWTWIFTNGTPSGSSVQNPTGITYNTPGCFDVTLMASNSNGSNTNSKTCYITVNAPAGLQNQNLDRLTLVPNPAETFVQISGYSGQPNYTILDVTGHIVLSGLLSASGLTELEIEGLAEGVYLLQLMNAVSVESRRLVIR